jgi:hypothetical protein
MSLSGPWWRPWAITVVALVTLLLLSGGCPGPHAHTPLEDMILAVAQTFRPLTRQQVRSHLVIPSPFYLSLGFDADVLDALDVGHSRKKNKTIIPVFDGEACVGHLERSERPSCPRCKKCHDPSWDCRYGQARWGIARGFAKQQVLYNVADATQGEYPFLLLTEGPGDVFKARRASFGAVALLGTDMSDVQIGKLAGLKKKILVAFDNDKAGVENAVKVSSRLRARGIETEIRHPPSAYKDVGEMETMDVATWLAA